jgi:molybdenum cofactor biosynthesis protein B
LKLDKSANLAKEILQAENLDVSEISVIPDEILKIQSKVNQHIEKGTSLILTIGGTGVSVKDVTIEAIKPILEKEMQGFGELFRNITYKEVGTVSIMTRALAGVTKNSCVVCLPGSPNAVELGTKLILEELLHIINLRR